MVAVLVGTLGFIFWQNFMKSSTDSVSKIESSQSSGDSSNSKQVSDKNLLKLDSVTLSMPDKWTAETGADKCPPYLSCVIGALVTPGEKLPTRYGNGNEFFNVWIGVYKNQDGHTAKEWLENDLQLGVGSGDVKASEESINGYDAFFRQEQYSGDGTEIREMHYVIAAEGKAVHIKARTYEPGMLNDGSEVGDFRRFEPEINALVKSITFKK